MRRFSSTAFLAAFATLLCTGLPAFSEEKTPYCPEKEPNAPDGIIVQMQDQYYRTCGRWSDRIVSWRQFILRVNPSIIPDLFTTYRSYNLTLAEQVEGQNRLQSSIRNQPNLGTKQFGGLNYISYASDFLGPTGKPNRITYVFAGNEEIPMHWVNCTGMGFAVEITTTSPVLSGCWKTAYMQTFPFSWTMKSGLRWRSIFPILH